MRRLLSHALPFSLALAALVPSGAGQAHDHDHGAEAAPLAPDTLADAPARAWTPAGAAAELAIEVTREAPDAWPGVEVAVRLRNDGATPVAVAELVVLDDARGRTILPAQALRVVSLPPDRPGEVHVGALVDRRESLRLLAAAGRDRTGAVVAGFPRLQDGATARLTLEPHDGEFHLSATLAFDPPLTVAPGETADAPLFVVAFSPDGLATLAWFLDETGAPPEDAPAGTAPDPADADLDRLAGQLVPLVTLPARGGGERLALPRFGVPLDLFACDGRPAVWRRPDNAGADVVLINWDMEPHLLGARFADLGRDDGAAWQLHDASAGVDLGTYRRSFVRPVPPRSVRRLRVEPAPAAAKPAGFELVVISAPSYGMEATVERLRPNEPNLAQHLGRVLATGGAVLANHRGEDVLEPLPAALAQVLPAAVRPCHVLAVAEPRGTGQADFVERAANVEWALDFPAAEPTPGAWLLSPQAGFDATPLGGVVADGFRGGRGFAIPTVAGVALVTIGLPEGEIDRLARLLAEQNRRFEVIRACRTAAQAVRAADPLGGVIAALDLDPLGRVPLVPGDPANLAQWSALVPPSRKTVRELATVTGTTVRADVVELTSPLIFALDVPPKFTDEVLVVVRRAPSRSLREYALHVDVEPAAPPVRIDAATEDPALWQEDLLSFGPDLIRGRSRLNVLLVPGGGALPLARVAFFVLPVKPGTPFAELDVTAEGPPPSRDRARTGGVLRVGDEAFARGFGLAPGGRLTVPLDGRPTHFLARIGVDRASAGDAAVFVVRVDGAERLRTPILQRGEPPLPLTVDVSGAEQLVLEVLPAESDAGADVDLLDARIVRGG